MQLRDLKIWMEANKNLLTREPHITKETEDLIVLGYQGLTDSLQTKIRAYGSIDVTVEHQGECWDIVKTFDCPAVKSADGRFYCSECQQPEYFDSELALWEHHTLWEWAEWINEIGTQSHEIRLGGIVGGMTTAFITQAGKTHGDDELVHTVLPVVVRQA